MALLVLASDLVGLPVAALETNSRVGKVHDVLVEAQKGSFEGVSVSVDWLSRPKFVCAIDIISLDSHGLVVKSPAALVDIAEVVRAKEILEKKFRLIGLKVVTQSGKRLGKVSDLVISTQTNKVVKFYVASWFNDRVIPWEKVIKVEPKAVVVEDDVQDVKVAAGVALEQS